MINNKLSWTGFFKDKNAYKDGSQEYKDMVKRIDALGVQGPNGNDRIPLEKGGTYSKENPYAYTEEELARGEDVHRVRLEREKEQILEIQQKIDEENQRVDSLPRRESDKNGLKSKTIIQDFTCLQEDVDREVRQMGQHSLHYSSRDLRKTDRKRNKYMREILPEVWVDVYDVINAFDVTDGGFQHALKKMLAPGQRGHKDEAEDRKDIMASVKRSNEIYNRGTKK